MPDDPYAEARLAAIRARQAERADDSKPDTTTSHQTPDELWAAARRREATELRAAAIKACTRCDPDGYNGLRVCDHQDHTAAAKRGIAEVRAALAHKPNQSRQNDRNALPGVVTPERPKNQP